MANRYTEASLRAVIAESRTYSEALRRLGIRPAGGNYATIRKYVSRWGISTSHFEHDTSRADQMRRSRKPLSQILVEGSTYHRGHLKRRLFAEGVKLPKCELCGQSEIWGGRRMALILDHINGVPNDNRLENLRIVCPNCAATFDTHCGRKNRVQPVQQVCLRCGGEFTPAASSQRYCSRFCGRRWDRAGRSRPGTRKVERPPYEHLMAEIAAGSYSSVGRRYGVSDNAVRKWVRQYERERTAEYTSRPAWPRSIAPDEARQTLRS
jgi:hypothetical protein